MGVERASLNSLALSCLQNHYTQKSDLRKSLFNHAIRNLKYIYKLQGGPEEDHAYEYLYRTIAAIQAQWFAQITKNVNKRTGPMDERTGPMELVNHFHL